MPPIFFDALPLLRPVINGRLVYRHPVNTLCYGAKQVRQAGDTPSRHDDRDLIAISPDTKTVERRKEHNDGRS